MSHERSPRRTPFTIVAAVARRFVAHQGFVLAGALSFSTLLCLAPLTLLLFSAAGFVLKSEQITEYVMGNAINLFPGYGDEVVQIFGVLTQERRITGLLGAVGLMAFASQLFSLIRTVTNTAFQVSMRRGVVHGLVVDLLFVAVLGLLAVILSATMLAVLTLGDLGRQLVPSLPVSEGARLAAPCLMYTLMIAVLFLVYRTAPNTRVPASAALVATVAVAVLWESARWGLTMYLARFGTYGNLYGSLGVVVATLVWIYYSAVIFVLGAELAAALSDGSRVLTDQIPEPPQLGDVNAPSGPRLPRYALAAVAGAVAAAFALQNTTPVTLRFLFWSIDGLSLGGVVLVPLASVVVAALVARLLARRRFRAEVRALGQRLGTLDAPPDALPDPRGTRSEGRSTDASESSVPRRDGQGGMQPFSKGSP